MGASGIFAELPKLSKKDVVLAAAIFDLEEEARFASRL
jgi:hypothetical protein